MAIEKGNHWNARNFFFPKKKMKGKKTHKTHPCLGSQQRDYRRRAWATGTGEKVVEVVQGRRRQAGQRRGVGDGMKALGPDWHFAVLDPAVQN